MKKGNGHIKYSVEERFHDRYVINKDSNCWEWQGFLDKDGYGWFYIDKKRYGAHRTSYTLHNGEIPTGLYVCHQCDNPRCVNPAHLFLGTQSDNMQDAQSKGRIKKAIHPGIEFYKNGCRCIDCRKIASIIAKKQYYNSRIKNGFKPPSAILVVLGIPVVEQ